MGIKANRVLWFRNRLGMAGWCGQRAPMGPERWICEGRCLQAGVGQIAGHTRCRHSIGAALRGQAGGVDPRQELLSQGLNPLITEVMDRDVTCLREEETIRDAIQLFLSCGISGAPVINTEGKIVGILSESDVITRETGCKLEEKNGSSSSCPLPESVSLFQQFIQDFNQEKLIQLLNSQVKEIMSRDPVVIDPDSTVFLAAKKMIDHKINRLPVVEKGEVVGILTRGDVLQCMIWELLVAGTEAESITG